MQSRRGFTLVELLVVIAVIGILVALLIPAVQAAREAARRTSCINNRKHTALAILNHASAHDRLPGLWREDRYSWRFTILPFLEESSIHDLLADRSKWIRYSPRNRGRDRDENAVVVAENPAAIQAYLCPSTPGTPLIVPNSGIQEHPSLRRGSNELRLLYDGMAAMQNAAISTVSMMRHTMTAFVREKHRPGAWSGTANGSLGGKHIIYLKGAEELPRVVGPAKMKWISDGTSKTILIHEQAGFPMTISPFQARRRMSNGHTWLWGNTGIFTQSVESGMWLLRGNPAINYANKANVYSFHLGGAHAAMCDGAVRFLSVDMSLDALFEMASRSQKTELVQ